MRWSERPPGACSHLSELELCRCKPRAVSVAVSHLVLVRPMKRILSCVFTSVLISAAVLPCAAQDQGETNFQKVVSALSGKWSIRETSDHGETTGEEVWQGGAGGMPFTEEFRASMSTGE